MNICKVKVEYELFVFEWFDHQTPEGSLMTKISRETAQ